MQRDLAAWLDYIEHQHVRPVDLGLERLRPVKAALEQHQRCPLITVGGTNGKGSTCAMLEAILLAAGYRVGLYTSPHLLAYNERVRIDGKQVDDAALCAAFAKVEDARGTTALTYFEFATLAAWEVFARQELDVVILEVGLGGRLDAVNIYDADCAIVTGIDIDHVDFLGDTREKIAVEKAGIFRSGKPAICADAAPPQTLLDAAADCGCRLQLIGRDFGFDGRERNWHYWQAEEAGEFGRADLPLPRLQGEFQLANASGVLAVLSALHTALPVPLDAVRAGLRSVALAGRFQCVGAHPQIVLDVAHNPQSARALAANLVAHPVAGKTWAVFGMLADKDIAAVVAALRTCVDIWIPCSLHGPRAADATLLECVLRRAGVQSAPACAAPAEALTYARAKAGEDDRIVAFGSFFTVAAVLQALKPRDMDAHGG